MRYVLQITVLKNAIKLGLRYSVTNYSFIMSLSHEGKPRGGKALRVCKAAELRVKRLWRV